MDVGEFNGRRLYARLKLDYRLRLWTVAKLLVHMVSCFIHLRAMTCYDRPGSGKASMSNISGSKPGAVR